MDPNTLRHLEFFSVPNNQTVNSVDQTFTLGGGSSAYSSATWNTAQGLNVETGQSSTSSTAPAPMSFGSIAHHPSAPQNGLPNVSANSSPTTRQPMFSSPTVQGLPSRAPRKKEGHGRERKRSRLSADATPFDSAEYWMEFDNEGSLEDIQEDFAPPPRRASKSKGRAPSRQGSMSTAHATDAASSYGAEGAIKPEDYIDVDDDALENALSDEDGGLSSINLAEHLAKIETAPPQDIPPREGLYSTPLSWERPQPGLRMDSLIGLNSPALNEAEQRRLIAIAMNPGPSMGGLGSNLNLSFGSGMTSGFNPTFGMGSMGGSSMTQMSDPLSSPQFSASHSRPMPANQPHRQDSMSDRAAKGARDAANAANAAKLGDRTAHNDIERKYRTNLKDKIAELRDAVPALHTISENGGDDDGSQPSRTAKVSKGTILTKATEYIQFLERKNKMIAQEHIELSRRLQAFEQLLNATARASYQMPNYSRSLFDPRGFC
ncbi:helix-loop-helix DNA-binding domain-containing protein [Bombardia bombarda]|uniref:Helix-loop-helix DNA-binding domain-containing protein n=1 Tax=Bombardia bombarda TaxID=252184 RepID=A0AA39X8P2_9PEZI|nr:helix-loop-helix DNA-binding domain-containing protein [Bombardia bombarda]